MGFTDYLTVEGQRLIAKSISDSLPITFTRVVMGTGYMNEGDVEKNVSEVITPAVTLNVTSVTMSGNESVIISTYFKNEELAEGFYFREKGIYLQVGAEEVLGIYGNAGSLAEYIDTAEVCIIEKMIRTVLTMSTDELENVTLLDGVSADTPIPFKEAEELEELKSGETLKVLFGKLAKGIKQLIAPEYTVPTAFAEPVSGESFKTLLGKIARLFKDYVEHCAKKATTSVLGHVKLSDSSAVTDSTGLALPATEKNAAIGGTLANQISKVNSDLGKKINNGSSPTLGSIELSSKTPFIDFHFDGDTGDFTSRIIESQKGLLEIIGTLNFKSGGIEMKGHNIGSVGDIFLNDKGEFLNALLNKFLRLDGTKPSVNPVSDANKFFTGIALFSPDIPNLPTSSWHNIVSGGEAGTVNQTATDLFSGAQYTRYCANNMWSGWKLNPSGLSSGITRNPVIHPVDSENLENSLIRTIQQFTESGYKICPISRLAVLFNPTDASWQLQILCIVDGVQYDKRVKLT